MLTLRKKIVIVSVDVMLVRGIRMAAFLESGGCKVKERVSKSEGKFLNV
jgi:hypothetical protein